MAKPAPAKIRNPTRSRILTCPLAAHLEALCRERRADPARFERTHSKPVVAALAAFERLKEHRDDPLPPAA